MLPWVVIRRFLPYIIIIATLVGAYLYVRNVAYNNGVEDTTLKYETAIQNERDRLREANRIALEEARKKEAELSRLLRERDVTISQLLRETLSDPDAFRPAISLDGVRRINRVD